MEVEENADLLELEEKYQARFTLWWNLDKFK
jgi:hypothetical protein